MPVVCQERSNIDPFTTGIKSDLLGSIDSIWPKIVNSHRLINCRVKRNGCYLHELCTSNEGFRVLSVGTQFIFLHGYVGQARCQTLRQVVVCIYYQLWLANWLEARFDCKIEIIVSIGRQMLRSHHYLILDRKSTRLNSSHTVISYAVFCLDKTQSD